jgi:hypothetical protein
VFSINPPAWTRRSYVGYSGLIMVTAAASKVVKLKGYTGGDT